MRPRNLYGCLRRISLGGFRALARRASLSSTAIFFAHLLTVDCESYPGNLDWPLQRLSRETTRISSEPTRVSGTALLPRLPATGKSTSGSFAAPAGGSPIRRETWRKTLAGIGRVWLTKNRIRPAHFRSGAANEPRGTIMPSTLEDFAKSHRSLSMAGQAEAWCLGNRWPDENRIEDVARPGRGDIYCSASKWHSC
jgi:hypothetical protein